MRRTDRDRHKGRQTGRQRGRQTNIQTDRDRQKTRRTLRGHQWRRLCRYLPVRWLMVSPMAAASIWFEIWEVVDPGKKNQFFQANFRKISIFFTQFDTNFDFTRKISEKFRIFRQFHKKIRFSRQKLAIYSNFWESYSTSLQKSSLSKTYTSCIIMIRYNNISPPVHDPHDPLPKIWGSRPSTPRTWCHPVGLLPNQTLQNPCK